MYDCVMVTSLSDHRITNALNQACRDLAEGAVTTLPNVAPADVLEIRRGLKRWADEQGCRLRVGQHGCSMYALVLPESCDE